MAWPTPQEYNEAVQNTHICFSDTELQAGKPSLNQLGLPKAATGAFASVYRVHCDKRDYAVRCFLQDVPDQRLRYERLSLSVLNDTLEYTVDFDYQNEGIRVGDSWFPILKMDWVEGENLDTFIKNNLRDKQRMLWLRKQFRSMLDALAGEGFAHGDLQHGNIIIAPDGLRLVDYDGMFVPALAGFLSNELGHRNYQHPARSRDHFGLYLDNFSAWVIDLALLCAAEDPDLYSRLHKEEALVLSQRDLKEPDSSETLMQLDKCPVEEVVDLVRRLRTILTCLPHNVPPLTVAAQIACAEEHPLVVKAREDLQRLAEWQAAEAMRAREDRAERLRAQQQQEELLRQQAEANHAVPHWLDEETASALSAPQPKEPPPPAVSRTAAQVSSQLAGIASNAQSPVILTPYPTKGEYLAALEDWDKCAGKALSGIAPHHTNGSITDSGETNVVLRVYSSKADHALKFYTIPIGGMQLRDVCEAMSSLPQYVYQHILKPQFVPKAISVNGIWCSATFMPWRKGKPLSEVLLKSKPDFDYTLLSRFRKAAQRLASAGIAVGSLEPNNVLVTDDNEVVFVDYDNFYTPALVHLGYAGHSDISVNYRHPQSIGNEFGPHMDNFQFWLLDTMILCWSADRPVWNSFTINDGGLFFNAQDMRDPQNSRRWAIMLASGTPEITERARFLLHLLTKLPADIPPLTADGSVPAVHS